MSWETALDQTVREYLPKLKWLSDEPLSRHTSFRIGGPARRMAIPDTTEELVILSGFLQEAGVRTILLGNGTNVLCSDEGLDAVVVATGELNRIERRNDSLLAEAGVSLAKLASYACREELTGLEFAHGIPGTFGGGIVMNAGAYGGSLSDVLVRAETLWPDGLRTLPSDELHLSYRHSVFTEQPDAVVLRAEVKLRPGNRSEIRQRMDELMEKRKASQPLEYPSAGSFFKRPAGRFAGRLIEECGLKGTRFGGAEVSEKHAGFVINRGGATCSDVLGLMDHVRNTVFKMTGVELEPEVRILR